MFQRLSAALALLSVSVVSVSAQTTPYEQLRELVKAYASDRPGEPFVMLGPVGDYPPKTVAELTQEAELVVHGRLTKLQTYVGPGRSIYSDYAIQNRRVLAGRSHTLIAQAQVESAPLVLTQFGGEMTIDGVQVRAQSASASNVVEGREYLMFLMPSRGGGIGRYESYHGGIFSIDQGLIRPLLRRGDTIFPDGFDAPLAIVFGQIERAAKALPKK